MEAPVNVQQQRTIQDMKPGEATQALPLSALQPMADAYLAFWRNAGRFQTEILRFITERMEKDVAHSSRLINCKTPTDFVQAQMDFVNSFFDDYTKEGRWVGEMMNKATRETQQTAEQEMAARQKH
jgi:Phasin protein